MAFKARQPIKHRCDVCGDEYPCDWCGTPSSYICPTINDDEDANTCDRCLAEIANDVQDAWDESHNYDTDRDYGDDLWDDLDDDVAWED